MQRMDYERWSSAPTWKDIIWGAVFTASPFVLPLGLNLAGFLT